MVDDFYSAPLQQLICDADSFRLCSVAPVDPKVMSGLQNKRTQRASLTRRRRAPVCIQMDPTEGVHIRGV